MDKPGGKKDKWDVKLEKIEEKNITCVNKPPEKIQMQKKPYSMVDQPKPSSKVAEDEIQTSFNSKVDIREPNKKPGRSDSKKKSININFRNNDKSLKPSQVRPINPKEIKVQVKSPEVDRKVAFLSEIFESVPKTRIQKIVAENSHLSEDSLYGLITELNFSKTIEKKKSSSIIRNTEKPLNLGGYKKSLCTNQSDCANPFCGFYHFEGERRRVVDNYFPKLCENAQCDNCEGCECAHTLTEIFYHESVYRKLSCPFQECPLQELCIFSHEVKQELSTLADKLNKEFEEALNKLELVKNKSEKIQSEINQACEEKKQLRQNLVCCCCETYRITYCFSSCGHCVCTKCISGYSQTYACSKCNARTRYIEIEYNYNKT